MQTSPISNGLRTQSPPNFLARLADEFDLVSTASNSFAKKFDRLIEERVKICDMSIDSRLCTAKFSQPFHVFGYKNDIRDCYVLK